MSSICLLAAEPAMNFQSTKVNFPVVVKLETCLGNYQTYFRGVAIVSVLGLQVRLILLLHRNNANNRIYQSIYGSVLENLD